MRYLLLSMLLLAGCQDTYVYSYHEVTRIDTGDFKSEYIVYAEQIVKERWLFDDWLWLGGKVVWSDTTDFHQFEESIPFSCGNADTVWVWSYTMFSGRPIDEVKRIIQGQRWNDEVAIHYGR